MDAQEETRNIKGCEDCKIIHGPGGAGAVCPCSCTCHYTRAELESRITFQDERLREAGLAIARLTREARPPASAELRALAEQNDKAAAAAAQDTDAAMVRLIAIQNRVLFMFAAWWLRSEVGAPR